MKIVTTNPTHHTHRIVLLDIAKGIGILLVFLGHSLSCSGKQGEMRTVLQSFHMPLFLFVSGIAFSLKKAINLCFREIAFKIFKGLFFPFLFFTIVGFVTLPFLPDAIPITLGKLKSWIVLFLRGISFSNGPLWFLPALAACQMFAWFLIYISKKSRIISLRIVSIYLSIITLLLYIIGCFIIVSGGKRFVKYIPFYCAVLPFCFIYFYMGMLFSQRVTENDGKNVLCTSLGALVAAGFIAFCAIRLPYMSLARLEIGHPVFAPIVAIIGIIMIVAISSLLMRMPSIKYILTFIGMNSLFYFSLDSVIGRLLVHLLSLCGAQIEFNRGACSIWQIAFLYFILRIAIISFLVIPIKKIYGNCRKWLLHPVDDWFSSYNETQR